MRAKCRRQPAVTATLDCTVCPYQIRLDLQQARRCVAAAITLMSVPLSTLAQEAAEAPIIGAASLPRDLSPWGMYLNADPVVQAVLIGLAFASFVTWTVWLAKTIEIVLAKRRVRAALDGLAGARFTSESMQRFAGAKGRSGNSSMLP